MSTLFSGPTLDVHRQSAQDIEIDPQMELENIMALLEAEVRASEHTVHDMLILGASRGSRSQSRVSLWTVAS